MARRGGGVQVGFWIGVMLLAAVAGIAPPTAGADSDCIIDKDDDECLEEHCDWITWEDGRCLDDGGPGGLGGGSQSCSSTLFLGDDAVGAVEGSQVCASVWGSVDRHPPSRCIDEVGGEGEGDICAHNDRGGGGSSNPDQPFMPEDGESEDVAAYPGAAHVGDHPDKIGWGQSERSCSWTDDDPDRASCTVYTGHWHWHTEEQMQQQHNVSALARDYPAPETQREACTFLFYNEAGGIMGGSCGGDLSPQ